MSRYDWSKAPKWAAAGATDANGRAYWYETKPILAYGQWVNAVGRLAQMDSDEPKWDKSLEMRPAEIDSQWPDAVERPSIPPLEWSA